MDIINEQAQVVYSLTAQNTVFALASKGKFLAYNLTVIT